MSQNPIFLTGNFAKVSNSLRAIDKKVLEDETEKINDQFRLHSLLQNINSVTALKQSILEICKFKSVYLTILAKGDDIVITENIKHCIDQCNQAKKMQFPDPSYEFNELIFLNINSFQILLNECLEHFIEMLKKILSCLTVLKTGSSPLEYFSQTHTWTGWAQNGHMALMSYNCLISTLGVFDTYSKGFDDTQNNILSELKVIAKCFEYIIKSYMNRKYPDTEFVLQLFGGNDNIINKDSLKLLEVDKKSEKQAPSTWNLKGIFG